MKYKLSDLIDIAKTQNLLDSFCDAVGIAAAIIDLEGEVLVGSRWQQICTDFHRINEQTYEKCIESDTVLANELQQGKHFTIYQCRNGLTDAASPIIIEGEHIANTFVGQFLLNTPDLDFFRQQAATYGFEVTDYLNALSKVPIVMQENLPAILDFLATFAEIVAVMGMDRLEQIEAEEALRESEKKYRDLVEESFDGIFIQKGQKIIFVNKRFNNMLGYNEGELVGQNHWVVYHPDYQKLTKERAQARMRGEEVVSRYEVKLQRKDGSWFYGEVNARPITFLSAEENGIQVWIKDIMEQKLAEKTLRASEEKYRLLIENATDAIFIAQDEVLRFANPKAEEMTGLSAEELTKIPFVDLIHPEDRDMVLERHIKRLKGEDIPSIYSFRILNRSGEELSVELNTVIIGWEGRPATLNFLRDITAQKRLEAQLQQAQKMEAVGTLAGGVAHDFNNLLMAIQGRTSIMRMDKDSSHPDFENLKEIESHIASAANLTRQLLGFARGGKYEVKPTDLNELIKKENRMFGRTRKEITIHDNFEENLWPVEVDRGQIEQVLMNLYVNAGHAMPGGGDLYLSTENVSLDKNSVKPFSIEPGRYVKVTVTDTGVGMDEAIQKRIFDPLFTTKEMGRGTGLGLASAYGIIKNHGGFISVYSEKGHGSTFNIYLPASKEGIIQEKEPIGDTLMGTETVLLVDDEDMIIEVSKDMLNHLGYKVLVAKDGKEAVEIYEESKEQIDIVLLDMIMPNISGGKTYDRLKEIDPHVKVLLSSGYSINGQPSEILDRGCNGFIQKPFKIGELSQELREVLDKK